MYRDKSVYNIKRIVLNMALTTTTRKKIGKRSTSTSSQPSNEIKPTNENEALNLVVPSVFYSDDDTVRVDEIDLFRLKTVDNEDSSINAYIAQLEEDGLLARFPSHDFGDWLEEEDNSSNRNLPQDSDDDDTERFVVDEIDLFRLKTIDNEDSSINAYIAQLEDDGLLAQVPSHDFGDGLEDNSSNSNLQQGPQNPVERTKKRKRSSRQGLQNPVASRKKPKKSSHSQSSNQSLPNDLLFEFDRHIILPPPLPPSLQEYGQSDQYEDYNDDRENDSEANLQQIEDDLTEAESLPDHIQFQLNEKVHENAGETQLQISEFIQIMRKIMMFIILLLIEDELRQYGSD